MSIAENINAFKKELPASVSLVAVSKTKPNEAILEAYDAEHRAFGENKVQELTDKAEALPKDIEWHYIGHVQTNKVKYMAPFVHLVHGVDREKVLKELNKQAAKNERVIDCLLQVHIAKEDSKFGFDEAELLELIKNDITANYPNVRVRGLMGMATFTENMEQVREEFAGLKKLFDKIKTQFDIPNAAFNILSTGMSGDYQIAIEEGSNMVRIGTAIFGERNY